MSQYMLLIYRPVDGPPAGQPEPPMEAWFEYTQSLQDAGALLHGAPLESVESATTVRARDGETQITDGPFAETKEILAGYYLLECPDLDAALAHAARIPNIHYGSIEVRPVVELGAVGAASGEAEAAS
jgi:hypothetical protein